MFGTYFYNETFKRAVSIFGTLFNNITIKKTKSDGTVLTEQKVPISYGPKQKFLQRLAEDADLNDGMRSAISLPRLAFELNGFNYDPQRQQNKLIRNTRTTVEANDIGKRGYQYQPAPYDLNFTLSVLAKNMNDALQIVEQILPYFNPDFNVTINDLPEMGIKRDLKITLDNVNYEDEYEGEYANRLSVIWTLNFTMRLNFYSHVANVDVIKKAVADIFSDPTMSIDKQALAANRGRLTVSVNPTSATPADAYSFLEEFDEEFET